MRTVTVHQILAELELLSHGSTQSWNPSGNPAERDPRPFGETRPDFLVFRERFERSSPSEWPAILDEAVDTLKRARCQQVRPKGESDADLEHRIVNGDGQFRTEGLGPHEVAVWARVTARFVMNARKRAGRDPLTGEIRTGMTLEEMADSGMSARNIATVLGKSPMTVQRELARREMARDLASKGLTQREIADKMGTSAATVNRLLSVRPVAA